MSENYERLGRYMKQALSTAPPAAPDLRARVLDAAAGSRRLARLRWPVLLATGALGAAAAVGLYLRSAADELACTRAGQAVPVAAWLDDRESAPLVFAEGTRIALGGGARARIAERGKKRVRMLLEAGQLEAEVVPRQGIDWTFHAGPYDVRVLGTGFHVAWDGTILRVAVRHGRVAVARTDRDEHVVVGAGARVVADAGGMRLHGPEAAAASATPGPVAPASGEASANPAAGPAVAPTAEGPPAARTSGSVSPAPRGAAVRGTSPSGAGAPGGWREAARAGRYVEAIAAAERAGLSGLLAGAPAEELLLLADAARLARRPELARDALGAIRRRDPGSPRAAMAAFRLARLEYDEGKSAEAAGWFEMFASEAPKDPLAESALGRPIEAWRRAGRPDRARAAAETYLRSHPSGSYARLAREVMGAPAKSPSPAQ